MNGEKLTLVGWMVVLLLLYFVSKSKTGHAIIYMGLFLILVFLLLVHYQQIDNIVFQKSS